ncbi:hypothetical protein DF186_15200, partial [Enterococcus hirae]
DLCKLLAEAVHQRIPRRDARNRDTGGLRRELSFQLFDARVRGADFSARRAQALFGVVQTLEQLTALLIDVHDAGFLAKSAQPLAGLQQLRFQ